MKTKILNFLQNHNIHYVESGNNVVFDHVNIKCPYCGVSDPSEHLGIHLFNGKFCCWRDATHSGNFVKLLKKILDCSWVEAKRIAGIKTVLLSGSIFDNLFQQSEEYKQQTKGVLFKKEFREIENTGVTNKFWRYLEYRGYKNIDNIIKKYNLKCCLFGEFSNRIIFPIYHNKKLVSWTSRSISENTYLKYMDLKKENSIKYVKNCIYNSDTNGENKENLYIVEGVFDVISIEELGLGKAVCIFTKTITESQKYILTKLSKQYKNVFIMLDRDAYVQGYQLKNQLSFINNVNIKQLPEGVNDPGELIL